jgi:hypothetical protein
MWEWRRAWPARPRTISPLHGSILRWCRHASPSALAPGAKQEGMTAAALLSSIRLDSALLHQAHPPEFHR